MISLTLTFLPTTGGTQLRWEADVIGIRNSTLHPPFANKDLALVLRALDVLQDPTYPLPWTTAQQRHFTFDADQQQRLTRLGLWDTLGRVSPDAPLLVGRFMFHALTADPEGAQALGTCRDHASALGAPLALALRFPVGAVALAALPWELTWDAGPTPLLLSRGMGGSCTRHLDLPQALPPPQRIEGPLRIVAVAPYAGLTPELRQIERAAREEAWGELVTRKQATIREISPATRENLITTIREEQPDIVHFFGHGRYDERGGALLIDTPDGSGNWLGAGALATLCQGVSLVALHACRGGVAGSRPSDILTGVAPALSAAGVPLVLAMQFTIRSAAAARLCAAVYAGIADGKSAQAALSHARRVLFVEESDQVSWFVPVLYVRSRTTDPALLRPRPDDALTTTNPIPPTRQLISAQSGSIIQGIAMQGGSASHQHAFARAGGVIANARMRAVGAVRQILHANDSQVEGVTMESEEG